MPKIFLKARVPEQGVIHTLETSVSSSSVIHYVRWISRGIPEFKNKTELDLSPGDLEIQFNSGQTYRFKNVPREVFVKLLDSESPGSFFNSSIRNLYIHERMEPHSLHKTKSVKKKSSLVLKGETEKAVKDLKILVDTIEKENSIISVFSNGINYVRYDETTGSLEIEFDNGNCYSFRDVSESTYNTFMEVKTKGSFYNNHIKNHRFDKLKPETLSELVP